jgi:large subunit ribosomal protein L24
MKQKFSKKWLKSKKRRKKRKFIANAPLHIKRKLMKSNLSRDLKEKYHKRSFYVRKGDEVEVMRGEFKGKTGKVNKVDLKNQRVSIEGIQRKKKDGGKVNAYFHPSKLQIQTLNLDDKKREKSVKRGGGSGEKKPKKKRKEKGKKSKEKKKGEKNASKKK